MLHYFVYFILYLITKVMSSLSSISRGLEFWSANPTLVYQNFESKVFENLKFLGEKSNNWLNDFLGRNVYKLVKSCW